MCTTATAAIQHGVENNTVENTIKRKTIIYYQHRRKHNAIQKHTCKYSLTKWRKSPTFSNDILLFAAATVTVAVCYCFYNKNESEIIFLFFISLFCFFLFFLISFLIYNNFTTLSIISFRL